MAAFHGRIARGTSLLALSTLGLIVAFAACSDTGADEGAPANAASNDGFGGTDSDGTTVGGMGGATATTGATITSSVGGPSTSGTITTGVGTTGSGGSTAGTTAGTTQAATTGSGETTGTSSGGMAGYGGMPGAGGAGGSGMVTGTGGAGGGGEGGTAGTGGGSSYTPCPNNGDPCKVMPLGDSITWGVGDESNGGYRGPLFALTVAAGQSITFTGSLSNGPSTVSGQPFPQKNEGHSGWGISRVTPYSGTNAGITTVIPSPGFDSGSGGLPHIILLHIGTNDEGSFSAEEMTSDLSGFLDKLISNAPDAYLVVAQIIPLGYGTNDKIRTYNAAIPGMVEERAAAGKHITFVDMYTDFNASTMLDSDSVHPNPSGYQFMADHWYSVIESLLPN